MKFLTPFMRLTRTCLAALLVGFFAMSALGHNDTERDQRRIDAVLEVLFETLDLDRGGFDRIEGVAKLLQKLRDIHACEELQSQKRRAALLQLKKDALEIHEEYSQSYPRVQRWKNNPSDLLTELDEIDPPVDDTVKNFIVSYFSGLKVFDSVGIRVGGGVLGFGLNCGLGGTISCDLSGRRWLACRPEVGVHFQTSISFLISGTVTKDVSKNWARCHHQQHHAYVVGDVTNLRKTGTDWSDARAEGRPIGRCVGLGSNSSHSFCVDIPFWPWFKDYDFPRKQLGLDPII